MNQVLDRVDGHNRLSVEDQGRLDRKIACLREVRADIRADMEQVRRLGNQALHEPVETIDEDEALATLWRTKRVLEWLTDAGILKNRAQIRSEDQEG